MPARASGREGVKAILRGLHGVLLGMGWWGGRCGGAGVCVVGEMKRRVKVVGEVEVS